MSEERTCVLCGIKSEDEDAVLVEFRGKDICKECIKKLDESRQADSGQQILHG